MDINNFFQSKIFKNCLFGLAIFIVILGIFSLGMFVGFRKANFSYGWGENYDRNFAGPRQGMMTGFEDKYLIDSHGVVGQIIKIDNNNIFIKGIDSVEKVVLVDSGTSIRAFRNDIKLSDLKLDDHIVVIGQPNNVGQIQAKFIRVMPNPALAPATNTDDLNQPNAPVPAPVQN